MVGRVMVILEVHTQGKFSEIVDIELNYSVNNHKNWTIHIKQ